MNPDFGYHSHYPVLAAAVARTSGAVLELGCGWGSTPMLRAMCKDRPLESYDTDKHWAGLFGVPIVEKWSKWEPVHPQYGVVFIDCAPGEERKFLALRLKGRAKFMVLHDHEAGSAAAYYYEDIIPQFKYAEVYRLLRPHTLILSDDEPFGLTPKEQEFVA
jgi:hypothetical protein